MLPKPLNHSSEYYFLLIKLSILLFLVRSLPWSMHLVCSTFIYVFCVFSSQAFSTSDFLLLLSLVIARVSEWYQMKSTLGDTGLNFKDELSRLYVSLFVNNWYPVERGHAVSILSFFSLEILEARWKRKGVRPASILSFALFTRLPYWLTVTQRCVRIPKRSFKLFILW